MTEAEREALEARKAALRAEIAELQRKIDKANDYKERLIEEREKTQSSVNAPVIRYDLTMSSDISHWRGNLEKKAEAIKSDVGAGLHKFMSGINAVILNLDTVIRKLREEKNAKQCELDSL